MATEITGKWNLYESQNFDDYLKAVGVNFLLRKLITSVSSSTLEITKEGDEYILRTISPMKTAETKFKINEEYEDKLMDGRECQSLFTLQGNVLTQRQRTKDGFETTIAREITPEEVVATIRYKEVTCIRKFRKASP
jgi:adenylate cyclase class IV